MRVLGILLTSVLTGNMASAGLTPQMSESISSTPVSRFSSDTGYAQTLDRLNQQLLENLYTIEIADANSKSVAQVNSLLNFSSNCRNFASIQEMGTWGQLILTEMKRNRYPELYRGAPDIAAACPNFNSSSMTDEGREVIWVMIVNAMAHLESSCKLGVPAKGPNGALIGLLQLHDGHEERYGKYCKRGDGKTAEGSFRCGLSMLDGQLSRDNALFSRKGYWDVLRPQAKTQKYLKIQKALKNLSICKLGAEPVPSSEILKTVPVPIPRPSIEHIVKNPTVPVTTAEPSTIEEIIRNSQTNNPGLDSSVNSVAK